jgi:cytochrome c
MRLHALIALPVAVAAIGISAGCYGGHDQSPYVIAAGGSPERGASTIRRFDCGSCHTIPGIRGARGVVGPPLTAMARRTYIAGRLPNRPDNLVRWVRDPHAVDELTAMPAVGLDEQQARDVAAYLYTLR